VKINRWQKFLLGSMAIALLTFGAARLYYQLTDDFRWSNITYEVAHRNGWETQPLVSSESAALGSLLQQPFYYIGKGAQSYAFASADGNYVLKFFKFKHLRPTSFIDWLPPLPSLEQYRQRQVARKQRKLEGVFAGYHVAFERHREESGLLFIHLNRTENSFPTVTVYDKIGWPHVIALDQVPFVVQYRVQTLRHVVQQLLSEGQLEIVKERLTQVFDLYRREYQKGIVDHDHGVMRNIGFRGDVAIHLDVGKLHAEEAIREPANQQADLQMVASRMGNWLQQHGGADADALLSHVKILISAAEPLSE
jgi:hypothetical protein